MKRIVILLIVITGLYLIFNQFSKTFQFDGFANGGTKEGSMAVSRSIDTIEVNVASVNTTIIPENRDDVKAVLTGKGILTVKKDGDTVRVSVKQKWFTWFSFVEKNKLTIYIPEDYHQSMFISLGSGNVEFSGESKKKPMKLDELSLNIGSGNMNLKHLEVNDFKQDVSSGNINIDYLKTKKGSFDVSSGNLKIKHYSGAINADISSGGLSIQMDQLTDSVDVDVSSGHVRLDLPDNSDFKLNGKVSSGKISCDFPLTSKGIDSKRIEGTHGSGKHEITIDVSSGNVTIQ